MYKRQAEGFGDISALLGISGRTSISWLGLTISTWAISNSVSTCLLYTSGTRPLGVVYCDISGLKTINDSQGHAQGDQMILSASQLLAEHFPAGLVYRIGGDEFLAVCFDDSRESFQGQVDRLLEQLQKNNAHLAVGAVWSEDGSTKIKELARQAENEMYRNKQQYYLSRQQPQNAPCPGPG